MKRADTAQTVVARRLLSHEAQGAESAEELAAAAGRVHEKIFGRLATLLGADGARALLARSVKLTAPEFPGLRVIDFDARPTESPAQQITTCLRGEAPATATETAVALCAKMLALLTTLIGERLTFQVLRRVWPSFDASAPREDEETK